jgi:hypothetical protein
MLGQSPKNEEQRAMSDVNLAANLLDEVIGTRGVREPVKVMLERAYGELRKRNQAWTRRRVRALFNKEANRIDYREIAEMRAVIEGKKAHAQYREETARIAALAAVQQPTEDRRVAQVERRKSS